MTGAKFNHDGTAFVPTIDRLPDTTHFAVLVASTISTPGYDRNDPPSSEASFDYIAFETEAALKAWIIAEAASQWSRKIYKVIRVEPVKIETTLSVKVTT